MTKLQFNGHVLDVHDSIQELPITRFQLYNLNMLIDSGIGSDLSATNNHINKALRLIGSDTDSARTELINLQQNLQFMISKTSPEMNSFVVLIDKINGRKIVEEDLTEEGIKEIIAELGRKRFSYANMKAALTRIKKKLDLEFEMFFPELTDSATAKEFYSQLKRRTVLILESIGNESQQIAEQIAEIDEYLFSKIKPSRFDGQQGLEVQMIKNFESTCTLLEFHKLSFNPKSLSTLAFHEKIIALKKLLKKK